MTAEICVALLTPFATSGEVAFDALEMHMESLISQGVTSVMPCGTTGEGMLLDPAEVALVISTVIRAAHGRARIVAHVGRMSTRETIALAQFAMAEGAAAVSAVVPYYYKYSDAQLREHYLSVLGAVRGAVYAYSIPDRTGNALPASVVRELGAAGLRGIKDSTKSLDAHREYLACGVEVLMGSDALVRDGLRLGASGAVSAIANIAPRLLMTLAATFASDAADVTQAQIVAIRDRTKASTSAIAALKCQLAEQLAGYPTHMRLPLS